VHHVENAHFHLTHDGGAFEVHLAQAGHAHLHAHLFGDDFRPEGLFEVGKRRQAAPASNHPKLIAGCTGHTTGKRDDRQGCG
jgi:hypothetical protein